MTNSSLLNSDTAASLQELLENAASLQLQELALSERARLWAGQQGGLTLAKYVTVGLPSEVAGWFDVSDALEQQRQSLAERRIQVHQEPDPHLSQQFEVASEAMERELAAIRPLLPLSRQLIQAERQANDLRTRLNASQGLGKLWVTLTGRQNTLQKELNWVVKQVERLRGEYHDLQIKQGVTVAASELQVHFERRIQEWNQQLSKLKEQLAAARQKHETDLSRLTTDQQKLAQQERLHLACWQEYVEAYSLPVSPTAWVALSQRADEANALWVAYQQVRNEQLATRNELEKLWGAWPAAYRTEEAASKQLQLWKEQPQFESQSAVAEVVGAAPILPWGEQPTHYGQTPTADTEPFLSPAPPLYPWGSTELEINSVEALKLAEEPGLGQAGEQAGGQALPTEAQQPLAFPAERFTVALEREDSELLEPERLTADPAVQVELAVEPRRAADLEGGQPPVPSVPGNSKREKEPSALPLLDESSWPPVLARELAAAPEGPSVPVPVFPWEAVEQEVILPQGESQAGKVPEEKDHDLGEGDVAEGPTVPAAFPDSPDCPDDELMSEMMGDAPLPALPPPPEFLPGVSVDLSLSLWPPAWTETLQAALPPDQAFLKETLPDLGSLPGRLNVVSEQTDLQPFAGRAQLTPEERTRQIAVKVAVECGLTDQVNFIEDRLAGPYAALKAPRLLRQLQSLTRDEIELAEKLYRWWPLQEHYGATYRWRNGEWFRAEASVSRHTCEQLVQRFSSVPSFEEVTQLLEDLHDHLGYNRVPFAYQLQTILDELTGDVDFERWVSWMTSAALLEDGEDWADDIDFDRLLRQRD